MAAAGCASVSERQRYFSEERNRLVGTPISQYLLWEPTSVRRADIDTDEYIYTSESGCEWLFEVDARNGRIQAWRYVSSAESCYERIDWFGPW